MVKYLSKNYAHPTNSCVKRTTKPHELRTGTECEREVTGNEDLFDLNTDNTNDGYCTAPRFVPECPDATISPEEAGIPDEKCPPSLDLRGYHRITAPEFFKGETVDGKCSSPYSRGVLGGRGFNDVIRDREEQLLRSTGKPVVLLRRQFTGPRCPCFSTTRGRSRGQCPICFGTGFVPGYIPYQNQKDPLGRIYVRFEPFTEDNPLKEQGMFQEITISAWTLSSPILRKRDVLIVYNSDGSEEFRYEVKTVTRNDIFGGEQGAQKFTLIRIDPTQTIYKLDPFKLPDISDISIDLSDIEAEFGELQAERTFEQLGNEDDGPFANVIIESAYGDGAFSGMFTEGYKIGYQLNFRRVLENKQPIWAPDFNEDGTVDDGYGPVFVSTTGKIIKFSTPQQNQENVGVNPLEVIDAEKKKHFLRGFVDGAKHGWQDGSSEARVRGLR